MKYAYYPGCSSETTAREYNHSALAVSKELGLELIELSDWNCCGASSAHSTSSRLSHSLTGRNLAIAEKTGMDTAVICPACFLRLRDTLHQIKNENITKDEISHLIDMPYEAKYKVSHLLDILTNIIGIESVKKRITKPLNGMKVVAYYGCYLIRPAELTGFDDPENPTTMDKLLNALGAEVLDWRGKVECCGGSRSLTDRDTVKKLVSGISDAAYEVKADAIITACGLCQANLESRQPSGSQIPALYFTEMMALAFGLDTSRWFNRHLINPAGILKKYGF